MCIFNYSLKTDPEKNYNTFADENHQIDNTDT